jgi:predicted Zn-dependent peptidase
MDYTRFVLPNGLTVFHLPDPNTQLAVMNVLYKVGSKDENPEKTGFAHLFEHLMFGGSVNIPEYDTPLQAAGGENNAFTSNDITNYYLTLPANNIETGFWLESDRMLSLAFSQKSLDVQKGVVIEEFKERYLNQPYGDVWLHLLPLAYTRHPYSWPTIGKQIEHIADVTLDDVKSFFANYYCPNNAILVVAGNVELGLVEQLCEKWFAPIPSQKVVRQPYEQEPIQTAPREKSIVADVPLDLIVKAWHTCGRADQDYFATDLLSDYLGAGRSAFLYNQLVKKQRLFSELDCYITADAEPGLLIIEGKLMDGVTLEKANAVLEKTISSFLQKGISDEELQKLKNRALTNTNFSNMKTLNRAMKLAYCEFIGNLNEFGKENDKYEAVTLNQLMRVAQSVFQPTNCSTLYYEAKK